MMIITVRLIVVLFLALSFGVHVHALEIEASSKSNSVDSASREVLQKLPQKTLKLPSSENLSVLNDDNTFCLIHTFSFHYFYVQVNTFSTQGFGDCLPKEYFKLSPISVAAQLATSGLSISRVNLSGVYHPTMDLSRISVNKRFENLGPLKFYNAGISKFFLTTLLADPGYISRYLKGATYLPYKTVEDVYYLWNPGTPIYELIDPDGRSYVMTSYTDMFLASLKVDSLKDLGKVLELPKGWVYRTRILEKVLAIQSISKLGNTTERIADNYNNIYILHDQKLQVN